MRVMWTVAVASSVAAASVLAGCQGSTESSTTLLYAEVAVAPGGPTTDADLCRSLTEVTRRFDELRRRTERAQRDGQPVDPSVISAAIDAAEALLGRDHPIGPAASALAAELSDRPVVIAADPAASWVRPAWREEHRDEIAELEAFAADHRCGLPTH